MRCFQSPLELPRSERFRSIEWLEPRVTCMTPGLHGDTYPITWARDDNLYAGCGDPGYVLENGRCREFSWREAETNPYAYERMSGMTVERFTGMGAGTDVWRVNDLTGFTGLGGNGPKPTGMLALDGCVYMAVQNLLGGKTARFGRSNQHGSDASILCSRDYCKSFTPDLEPLWRQFEGEQYDRQAYRFKTSEQEREQYQGFVPMFPGALFGGPSFVQFGKDGQDATDEYVYAASADQWDNGRDLRIGRVHRDHILERDVWEFVRFEGESPVWTSNLDLSEPVLSIDRYMSAPEVIYLKDEGVYILLTWALHKDFATEGSSLIILESESLTGEWKLVYYEWMWETPAFTPYCPRIPMKWFDHSSLSGYMLYSGSWARPEPYYRPHMRRFRFIR